MIFSQNVTLDTAFGVGGKVVSYVDQSTINRFDIIQSLAIQPDGKIVACGKSKSGSVNISVLMRYNSNGTFDTTFGTNGIVTVPMGSAYNPATCVKLLSDGKIIVSGESKTGSYTDFCIARYNSNGSLDATFGTNGLVTTDFGGKNDVGFCLEIQPDNKIIVSGYHDIIEPNNRDSNFAVARYNYDGTLDNSFGSMGKVSLNFGANLTYSFSVEIANCAKLQSDGKIIVAGYTDATSNYGDKNFALLRLNADGSLDSSFGVNGKVITDFGGRERIFWIVITPDDKIIGVGNSDTNSIPSDSKIVLAKYQSNGALDTTFGTNGKVETQVNNVIKNDLIRYAELQSDGKLVCTGYTLVSNVNYTTDFLLMRYNANGSLDTTFDNDGIVTTNFTNGTDQSQALKIQSDGKILCGGSTYESSGSSNSNFALVRYSVPNLATDEFLLSQNDIRLYPNPFSNDGITIELELEDQKIISIGLFDINGRELKTLLTDEIFNIGRNTRKLTLPENLQKGYYFLRIHSGKSYKILKIIKE